MSALQAPRKEDVLYMSVPDLGRLVAPTLPMVANKLDEDLDKVFAQVDDALSPLGNLLGWPALSVPCGFVSNLPIGMLILGAYGRDDDVLSAGIDYQRSSDWHKRRPPL
jgi:aspartyl-tRNA(Asn)/glutamyl-tRNA(Gln) amidotransferase subunit A